MNITKNILKLVIALILMLNFSCKQDPCKDQVCFNGGACVDGDCICVNGYTGTNCQNEPPCANVTCFNNGTCINGNCDCPPGYSGNFCEIVDPCLNINCQNGGDCTGGVCDCPTGYGGIYCQNELTPTSFRLQELELNEFPDTDGPYCWDSNSQGCYPDVYLVIKIGSTALEATAHYQNITSPGEYTYTISPTINMHYNSTYTIQFYDYDPNATDELLTSGNLTLSNVFTSAPYYSTLSLSGTSRAYKLKGNWQF